MSPPYLYAFSLFLIAAVAIALLLLASLQRRGQRGMRSFIVLAVCLAIWSAGYGMELLLPTLSAKMIWVRVQYLGIAFIPTATLVFAFTYSGYDNLTRPGFVALLSAIPLITVVLVATSNYHDLFYRAIDLDTILGWPNFSPTYSFGFWVNLVYAYIALAIAVGIFAIRLWRASRLYLRQNILLIVGALAPWLANLIHVSGLNPFPGLDLTPYGFSVTLLVLGFALVRLNLLDIMPAAHDLVVDNMLSPVFVLDKRDRVIGLNMAARELVGPVSDGMTGRPLVELLPEAERVLKERSGLAEKRSELTRPGSEQDIVYTVSLAEVRSRRGRGIGHVFVLHDITEQKHTEQLLAQARDQAVRAGELKSRMVAVVSHDFRTPLMAVGGYAELLKEEHDGPLNPTQKSSVTRILERTGQLTRLVNDLLDHAQLEAGQLIFRSETIKPAELVQAVENSLRGKAEAKGLQFKVSVDEEFPSFLQGDKERLVQVVTNLADNAIKFTAEGSVTMRFYMSDASHWACEVRDTGIGLTAVQQTRVFDAFWQGIPATDGARRRPGLGLSIVKELVTLMKGTISVDSESGKGTRFVVTFPVQTPPQEPPS